MAWQLPQPNPPGLWDASLSGLTDLCVVRILRSSQTWSPTVGGTLLSQSLPCSPSSLAVQMMFMLLGCSWVIYCCRHSLCIPSAPAMAGHMKTKQHKVWAAVTLRCWTRWVQLWLKFPMFFMAYSCLDIYGEHCSPDPKLVLILPSINTHSALIKHSVSPQACLSPALCSQVQSSLRGIAAQLGFNQNKLSWHEFLFFKIWL